MPSAGLTQPGLTHRETRPHHADPKVTATGHGIDRSMVAQGTHEGSHHGIGMRPGGKTDAQILRQLQDERVGALDDPRAEAEDEQAFARLPSHPDADLGPRSPWPVGTRVEVWLDADDCGVESARPDGATGGWHQGIVACFYADSGCVGVVLDEAPAVGPVRVQLDNVQRTGQVFRRAPHPVQRQLLAPALPPVGSCPPLSAAELASGGLRLWLRPRGTTGLPLVMCSVLVSKYALIDDLKHFVKNEMSPVLDGVPKCAVQIYFRNERADDYILLQPHKGVAENPMPEAFTDIPGVDRSFPLYWEWDKSYASVRPETKLCCPPSRQPQPRHAFPESIVFAGGP
eukprot:TRINITY_DN19187_c0_g1_i1.p1 TRINITY_DN19187_c0_g1~~TRINITY_DN19187_c0_g1_i1.p1  ORF type:complete len:375 (+),score=97.21 TRINITY_DN19187_c0_g1_i1:98-1126(+)